MPKCPKCSKEVYFAERVTSLGKDWHRPCLKCEKCGKTLTSGGPRRGRGGLEGGKGARWGVTAPHGPSICSMKASPIATTPATQPCSGPKALGAEELRATLSSRPRLWRPHPWPPAGTAPPA
uniref:LIM zinc-binding domain-containing protein n=1 Tax=Equus asinus TaxID=9793 RepID=A0A9L0J6N6_EQUAS